MLTSRLAAPKVLSAISVPLDDFADEEVSVCRGEIFEKWSMPLR